MADQLSLLDLIAGSPPQDGLLELWTPDDIYSALSADNLTRFQEDKRLERKSARKTLKDVADDLCAFANAQPHGGVVLVGVEDDGAVTGFSKVGTNRISDFEGINPHCSDARVESRRIAVLNDKGERDLVIAIRVHFRPDRLVETASGQSFLRIGGEKRRLTEAEKREIRITRGEIDYEKEPVRVLVYPDDFSLDLINSFYTSFVEKRNLRPSPKVEEVLSWCHLGTIDNNGFQLNLACTILFAKDPRSVFPGARIRFQRFSGYVEGTGANCNLINEKFIDGPAA